MLLAVNPYFLSILLYNMYYKVCHHLPYVFSVVCRHECHHIIMFICLRVYMCIYIEVHYDAVTDIYKILHIKTYIDILHLVNWFYY